MTSGALRARRAQPGPSRLAALRARIRSTALDQELAGGIAPWRSPAHAARALQLTSDRRRRAYADGLERLLAEAEQPRSRARFSAIVIADPALLLFAPLAREIIDALRASAPVSAEGMARLGALLCDGSGPLYLPGDVDRLRQTLEHIARWINVAT